MNTIFAQKTLENGFFRVKHKRRVASTNDSLKTLPKADLREGFVLVADMQTKGKGRLGRSFLSPKGGLYFSILLSPKTGEVLDMLTVMSAVAVAKAIRNTTGDNAGIKWVNDVYVNGRKVSGILTETSENLPGFAIVGIGVNVGSVPKEVEDIARGVTEKGKNTRQELLEAILHEFAALYLDFDKQKIAQEYKSLCVHIGRAVTVFENDGSEYFATAKDLDDDCHLVVEDEQGKLHTLNSGEVKILL